MKILVGLLIFSLLINFTVFYLDTLPFLLPKIKRRFKIFNQIKSNDIYKIEELIVESAFEMSSSQNVRMIWSGARNLSERTYLFFRYGNSKKSKLYHYPKSYLMYGLLEYLISKNNKQKINQVKKFFERYYCKDDNWVFKIDKVDQVPFGLVAICLYKVSKDLKYKNFFNSIYNFIIQQQESNGNVLYRKSADNQYCDLIGMIVPFLVEYYKITNNKDALKIAKKQLDFYIKYGLDKETLIPSHGIHLESKIKTGSSNWGRGIGWYLLGLSYYYEVTGEYHKEFIGIKNSLAKLQLDNKLYSQFPGSSNTFDASSSTMFLSSLIHLDDFVLTREEVLAFFSEHVDKKGRLMQTSGDTYGLNSYAEKFGLSELSQGMLLLLLSRTKN